MKANMVPWHQNKMSRITEFTAGEVSSVHLKINLALLSQRFFFFIRNLVWPDLAKSQFFGKIVKAWAIFWDLFSIRQTV